MLVVTGARGAPRSSPHSQAAVNVKQLIHDCVYNQLKDMRNPEHRYQYTHYDVQPGASRTTVEIETPRGTVARLTEVNGKPPTEKQCRKNRAQLAEVASSSRAARQQLSNQRANLQRRENLFEALPQAVLFHYEGVEEGSGLVRLTFKPNPAFRPRTREAGVLQGLAGAIWLDPSDRHFTKIQGQLVNTVSFGWGILAKLYRGRFTMEQTKLPDGGWRLTTLNVSFHGVVLLFKGLNVNMKESYGMFQEAPLNLSLAQAVKRLDNIRVDCR